MPSQGLVAAPMRLGGLMLVLGGGPAGLGACGAVIAHMQCLITGFQLVPKLNLDAGVSFHQLWTPPWQDDPTPGCTP